ncbi:MAG TPA: hypothetical protein VIL37_15975 [Natronosporangium sp.]
MSEPTQPNSAQPPPAGRRIDEDWAATILGLVLLVLVLVGAIPTGVIP